MKLPEVYVSNSNGSGIHRFQRINMDVYMNYEGQEERFAKFGRNGYFSRRFLGRGSQSWLEAQRFRNQQVNLVVTMNDQ